MLIKKIRLENIRSYENQEIEFPKGSILLSGDIGSGKTSVLMAIEFALFGLQPSQRGSSLLKNGKDSGRIWLELEIAGKNVIIERGLKKSGKTITQEFSTISINNEKFEGAVTEIKNRVLSLINYPSEFAKKTNLLYKFTVYTPQEEMKQIILESPESRLNTLRHVFGIDKYKRIAENIKIFSFKLREKIRGQEGMLADVKKIKENLEEKKKSLESLRNSKKTQIILLEEKKQARYKVEEEIKSVEKKIKERETLEKEKDKSDLVLKNKRENLFELKKQIEKLKKEIDEGKNLSFNPQEFQEIISSIQRNKEQEKKFQEQLIGYSGKHNSLLERKKESQELKEKISKLQTCPTCLQNVEEKYKENIYQKIDSEMLSLNENLKELEKQKSHYAESLESLRKQISSLEEQKSKQEIAKIKLEALKEKEKTLSEIEVKKRQTEMDAEMMLTHLKNIEESISSFSKFTEIYEQSKKNLDAKKQEERSQEIKVVEISKEIDLTITLIEEIEKQIKEKEEVKKRLEHLKELENWLSDKFLNMILFTEKNVMLKLKDEFSKLFSEWFSILVSETLSVRLSEEFTPIIEQQGFEIAYNYLSGGERTSVALAYRLALNQVINSLLSKIKTKDLVILDEPTDGFSESQLDKMRDVLQQLKVQQLILVSHEAKIESFVDNIIKFKKEAGITKVES